MKKIRNRVTNIKPYSDLDDKCMNLLKSYISHVVNPLLKDFLKNYCSQQNNHKFDFADSFDCKSSRGFKNLALKNKISD